MDYNILGYKKKWVGMIRWCYYWDKYALILEVGDDFVTELDAFGIINETSNHKSRTHHTLLHQKDKIYSIGQFYQKEINKGEHNVITER